jgi:hypothetical protein
LFFFLGILGNGSKLLEKLVTNKPTVHKMDHGNVQEKSEILLKRKSKMSNLTLLTLKPLRKAFKKFLVFKI